MTTIVTTTTRRRSIIHNIIMMVIAAGIVSTILLVQVAEGRRLMTPSVAQSRLESQRPKQRQLQDEGVEEIVPISAIVPQEDAPSRWDECVGLTGAECETLILNSLNGSLENHPIPNLQIKINKQRDAATMEQTKWMFGVASTLSGETDCDLYDGHSVYPFVYEGSDGNSYEIPDIPCKGKTVLECCDAVTDYMETNGIPLTDIDGNCFSCWVYQQPLKPQLNVETGAVDYVEHTYNEDTDTCEELVYTAEEVASLDNTATNALTTTILPDIQELIDAGNANELVDCIDVTRLIDNVRYYGRSYPIAMTKIAGLFCDQDQCTQGGSFVLASTQISELEAIKSILSVPHDSAENCIIVYTDSTGTNVLKVPQVGGSLNDELPAPEPAPSPIFDEDEDDPEPNETPDRIECPAGQMNEPNGDGCMCDAVVSYDELETFWTPNGIQPSGADVTCTCPGDMFSEFNNKCWCKGGFKLYNPSSKTCECPFGIDPVTQDCICPSSLGGSTVPNPELGWNQVGWISSGGFNGLAGCKLDEDCVASEFEDYETFDTGCNICPTGKIESDDGTMCVLPCDESRGYKYDDSRDKCVCIDEEMQTELQGQCRCTVNPDQTLNYDTGMCECPPTPFTNLEQVNCFEPNAEFYYCTTFCPTDTYGYDPNTPVGVDGPDGVDDPDGRTTTPEDEEEYYNYGYFYL